MGFSKEQVEAAAIVLSGASGKWGFYEYPFNDFDRESYRKTAREVLAAAEELADEWEERMTNRFTDSRALIAEAQEHYSEMNGLNSRAAEVMMELVAALEAKTGVRVDMSSAVGVEAQLAATRVPVQGEPNAELIAEARAVIAQGGTDSWEEDADVMRRLAAALESVTRVPEQGEATAAVERVRIYCENQGDKFQYHAGVILAALEEAPEPEWEERLAACDKHGTHCWSCTRYMERRRPAGEWHRLPVEGEKK